MVRLDNGHESLGESLVTSSDIEERRKERCVMFVDPVGSNSFVDRHRDVAGRRRVRTVGEVVLPIAERHGGRPVKEVGDGWMILFTDPNQAIQAAIEMERENQEAQRRAHEPAQLKIGLDYGRILEEPDDLHGDVVNNSRQLVENCTGDSILIGNRLFESLDPFFRQRCFPEEASIFRGKGKSAVAYRVCWQPLVRSSKAAEVDRLVVEVLWEEGESRIALADSLQQDHALISYEPHPLSMEEIEETAEGIHTAIGNANIRGTEPETEAQLRELGEKLFGLLLPEEIRNEIRTTKTEYLILKLDDSCVHLPWELMHDGNDFLCCRFSVGRVVRTRQSTTVVRRPAPIESVRLLAISNPTGDLPAATEECQSLYETYSQDPRVDFEWHNGRVPLQDVTDRLKDFDIVHYCGHADYCSESPDESGWILFNGRFSAGDLQKYHEEKTPVPLLVFNNACHSSSTSSWKDVQVGWSFGLANAFLLAGSTHYIGAVSDLLDRSSKDFSLAFYKRVIAGHSVGTALRQAREKQRSGNRNRDLTWAQYILYGNPEMGIFAPLEPPQDPSRIESEPESQEGASAPLDRLRTSPATSDPVRIHGAVPAAPSWMKVFVGAVSLFVILVIAIGLFPYLQHSEEEVRMWTDKAVLLEREGNLEAAKAALDKAAILSPEDPFVEALQSALAKRIKVEKDEVWFYNVRQLIGQIREQLAERKGQPERIDPWTSRPLGIAILDIESEGTPPARLGEDTVFIEELASAFDRTDRWSLVERERLHVILQELGMGSSEFVNSNHALEVGRFLAVRGLLAGRIFRDGETVRVSLRVIDTETRVVSAMITDSTTREVTSLSDSLADQLIDQLNQEYVVQGRIVESASGSIILNIGSEHGVQMGQHFTVFPKESDPRSAESVLGFQSIGILEVSHVEPFKCACIPHSVRLPLESGMRARERSNGN